MSEPGYVFTTLAFEYKTGGLPPAGFFCLWDDQLTFIRSRWVREVVPCVVEVEVAVPGSMPAAW
jgi:hypothetical protein